MKLINTLDGSTYDIEKVSNNLVITIPAKEDLATMGADGAVLLSMAKILAALSPDVDYVISSVIRSMTGAVRPDSTHSKGWSLDMGLIFKKPNSDDYTLWLKTPWAPNLCDNHRLLRAIASALTHLIGEPKGRGLAWVAEADHWHLTRCLEKALPLTPPTWVYSFKSKQNLYDAYDPRSFAREEKRPFYAIDGKGNMTLLLSI